MANLSEGRNNKSSRSVGESFRTEPMSNEEFEKLAEKYTSKSKRNSVQFVLSEEKIEKDKAKFGTTSNYRNAGFIMLTGEWLDLLEGQ